MREILLCLILLFFMGEIKAQIFLANDTISFGEWTFEDIDADGQTWGTVEITNSTLPDGISGEQCLISYSYDPNTDSGLTPDNLAISPAIDFSNHPQLQLNWTTASLESTSSGWHEEHYAVYVVKSEDLPEIMAGTFPPPVFETTNEEGLVPLSDSIDISDLAGGQNDIHLIYRHYMCTDENALLLLEVEVVNSMVSSVVDQSQNDFEVSVFPNPTTSELNINIDVQPKSISFLTPSGKVVAFHELKEKETTIDVSKLSAGMYIYEVISEDNRISRKKFIKK